MTAEHSANIDEILEHLIEEFEQVQLDFNRRANIILTELRELRDNNIAYHQDAVQAVAVVDDNRPLQVGDSVEIINNYRGLRGTEGLIIRITRRRVTIRDTSGIVHTRSPSNIRRLN